MTNPAPIDITPKTKSPQVNVYSGVTVNIVELRKNARRDVLGL